MQPIDRKGHSMNKEKFLKARVPAALYEALLARAGEAGQRLGTYVREVLERDAQVITTREALARIEAVISTSSAAPQPTTAGHNTAHLLHEVRLLLRELCMQTNAQIVARVAAQLAAQAAQPNH
jgi:hypothetical protein